jgi:hypothetical protein
MPTHTIEKGLETHISQRLCLVKAFEETLHIHAIASRSLIAGFIKVLSNFIQS